MLDQLNVSTWSDDLYSMWVSLAPLLLIGGLISGALHALLPPFFIRRALSGGGGVIKAVLAGVPLPLCSCSVIPTGLGLKRDGASDGATVGFLISTPQTGVDSILVSASLLGLPFALFKVLAAAVTGLIGGGLTNHFSVAHSEVSIEEDLHSHHHEGSSKWRAALTHIDEVIEPIWGWVLFGVIASVVIQRLIPASLFEIETGLSILLAYSITLSLSIPLYICATASVPIAAALVAQGYPIGVALIFLMAGPATNIATLGAVYRGLGRIPFTIYLGTIIVGSIVFALVLDLGLGWTAPVSLLNQSGHQHRVALWEHLLAFICALLFVNYAWSWLRYQLQKFRSSRHGEERDGTRPLQIGVSGLTCQGCVRRLESGLLARGDVIECQVNEGLDSLTVHGTLSLLELQEVVREVGFTPSTDLVDV